MKFIINNHITYEVEEQLFYNLLKQENITVEDYKKVVCNDFKEMLESEIGTSEQIKNVVIETDIQIENNTDSYCPICAENIGDEPFCSSCGDVSGAKVGEYSLHERDYYIQKQIRVFGKVEIEPVNYLKGE